MVEEKISKLTEEFFTRFSEDNKENKANHAVRREQLCKFLNELFDDYNRVCKDEDKIEFDYNAFDNLFEQFDADGNGTIDQVEFKRFIEKYAEL